MPYGTVSADVIQSSVSGVSLGAGNASIMKNRIINGACVISQRGTSPTITGGGDYSIDRFYNYYSGPVYTSVQSTTAPTGFVNSLKLTVTTPSASPTYSFFGQKIEGYNTADLGFGTANAKTVTVSFWVQSSVAGIYSISLVNEDGTRSYPQTYTITSANTWQQITATIAGDTSGTWNTINSVGINLRFNMGSGASRLGTSGSWQAGNYDGATGSTGSSTWANTSGATFYVTGVQLEVGTSATGYEYRQYGTELALCQRYYQSRVLRLISSTWSLNTSQSANRTFQTMRAAPTISTSGSWSGTAPSASGGNTDTFYWQASAYFYSDNTVTEILSAEL